MTDAPERIWINPDMWDLSSVKGEDDCDIEYLRYDIHEKELREVASFIIGAMNYGRIWTPDEALTAFFESKQGKP